MRGLRFGFFASASRANGFASIFLRMFSGSNSLRGIGPMMPKLLRVGVRNTGIAPVIVIACRIDLWQLRSTSTMSPGATVPCQTILFDVDVPLVTKNTWSALKMRAALRSEAATGPVWSSSWPSSSTALQTSARSMFSPKNWWNIWPSGLFRNATPPECPGQCHEYEPSSAYCTSSLKNGGASESRYTLVSRMMWRATNSGVSSNMWMKPCSSRRMSFGRWREVRVSPYRKIGMSALRRRTSVTNARSATIAAASSGVSPSTTTLSTYGSSSSSSIDRMKHDARLDCCANEVRSP